MQKLDEVVFKVPDLNPAQLAANERAFERAEREAAAERAERDRSQRRSVLAHSRVLPYLMDEMSDALVNQTGLKSTPALEYVDAWLRSNVPLLGLFGGKGLGKTVSAASAILTMGRGHYVEADELARLYSSLYGKEKDRYEKLVESSLLCVDELGLERNAEVARAALHDVVNRRQGKATRTLFMGNIDMAVLTSRYDSRTLHRIQAIGMLRALTNESLRPVLEKVG